MMEEHSSAQHAMPPLLTDKTPTNDAHFCKSNINTGQPSLLLGRLLVEIPTRLILHNVMCHNDPLTVLPLVS